jgi:hypothetical protein
MTDNGAPHRLRTGIAILHEADSGVHRRFQRRFEAKWSLTEEGKFRAPTKLERLSGLTFFKVQTRAMAWDCTHEGVHWQQTTNTDWRGQRDWQQISLIGSDSLSNH